MVVLQRFFGEWLPIFISVVPIGFIELRKTLQEQSVTYTYHRMGDNLRPEDNAEIENL